jgi:hypothetical protein
MFRKYVNMTLDYGLDNRIIGFSNSLQCSANTVRRYDSGLEVGQQMNWALIPCSVQQILYVDMTMDYGLDNR